MVTTNSSVAGVVRRGGAERLHVGAVPGLGHREAAQQPPRHEVGEVGVVVAPRAEHEDRAAEQPELHTDLHQHRQVAVRQGLERRDRRAEVAPAAVLLREAHPGLTCAGHGDHEVSHPLAEVRMRQGLGFVEHRRVLHEVAADQVAHVGVAAVEEAGQLRNVDRGRPVRRSGLDRVARSGVDRHVPTLPGAAPPL